MTDHLAEALNTMKTHEMAGQTVCTVKSTKLIEKVLNVLKEHKYLSGYERMGDGRGESLKVTLDGRINDCGVIKPRMPVKKHDWAKKEQRYIPGIGVGLLIVSSSKGVMTNADAEAERIGGRLLAYVY